MLVCAFLCATCTRDRGCSAHPAFPAPSSSRGTTSCAKLGQSVSREHGFLSVSGEAPIKLNGPTMSLRGALATKQSILPFARPLGLLRTPVAHSRDHWLAMTMDLLPPNFTRDVDRELQFRPLLFFRQAG